MEEEKERRARKKRVIKIAAASLFALLCLWYIVWCNIHVSRQFMGTFWSENGEKVEISFDLTWYRYACLPSELHGTITVNGTTYVGQNAYNRSLPFPEKLRMKLLGKNYYEYLFVNPDIGVLYQLTDCIRLYVEEWDKQFEEIEIWLRDEDTNRLVNYYGPAETFEEARRIYFQKRGLTH